MPGKPLRSEHAAACRVVSLDSCQDVLAGWRMPMFLLHMGDQRIRELVGIAAREDLLAPWAPNCEVVHVHQCHRQCDR